MVYLYAPLSIQTPLYASVAPIEDDTEPYSAAIYASVGVWLCYGHTDADPMALLRLCRRLLCASVGNEGTEGMREQARCIVWLCMANGVFSQTPKPANQNRRGLALSGASEANIFLFFTVYFSVFFAFSVGLTTSNFGSLVRYKIPAIPFFLISLIIISATYKDLKAEDKLKLSAEG